MLRSRGINILNLLIFIIITYLWLYTQAYAATTTVTYVWTANDLWGWSFSWNNLNNVIWDTTLSATDSNANIRNENTNFLSLTNFDLSSAWLPFWSVINGIQVDVEWMVSHNRIRDWSVQLTKDWITPIWNNYANQANWPTTKTINSYGWSSDLWGTTWTYAELTDPNFWVLLQYRQTRNRNENVYVYRVWVTIDYTPNNPPSDISLSNNTIASWLPIWSVVWALSTTDADISDSHSYSLNCSIPWADDASFSISWDELQSAEVYDYTIKSTYNICIRTDDARWWTYDKNFVIIITPPTPNNPPTDITLSNNTIYEALPIWSLVWTLSTTDLDISDSHSYDFNCSTPWIDDASFSISWDELQSAEVFDEATKSTYNICIRTDDARWWTYDKNFVITILVNPNLGYAYTGTDIWWWNFFWNNPSNAELNTTNTFANSTMNVRNSDGNYLALTNFNLDYSWLPENALINGIQVDVEWNVSNNRVRDWTIQLTKDWTTPIWNNYANQANWPTAKTITSYWGLTDLWWTTWTAQELFDQNFWVLLQYRYTRNGTADVNVYRVKITVDYSIVDGPWWVTSNLQFWLRADKSTSTTTSWNALNTWWDQSSNWYDATAWNAPTYLNDTTNNLNFNPYVDFNWTNDYMENLSNWAYSHAYYLVVVPDNQVDWTVTWQVPFWFDCNSGILNTWTCWLTFAWSVLWAFTAAINDELVTLAIWSSTWWRWSQIWAYSYEANKPMLLWFNENAAWNNTDIYESWFKIDNYTANTYQNLSSADYNIGRSPDGTYPFYYDWKVAEIINYSSSLSDADRQKIESYLALKYGITLNNWNQDYISSNWTTLFWSSSLAWIYTNDIFWIARDDTSSLSQIKSKSVNNDSVLTLEAVSEGTNISPSFVDMADLESLSISNNGLWNTWKQIWTPSWYYILERVWLAQENWEVWTVNLDFDVANTDFDIPELSIWTNYYFIYDSNNNDDLSDETPVVMTNTTWDIWQIAWVDIDHLREFSIATQASTNNIPTDISLDNDNVDENSSIWTSVWDFSTTDADSWDTHTYSLVAWTWDDDNYLFSISWSTLIIETSADYEIKNTYTIRVQTDDGNGGQYQEVFTIYINNVWETTQSIIDFEDADDENRYSVTSWNWTRTTNNPQEWSYSIESATPWNSTQACFEVVNTFSATWTISFEYNVSTEAWSDYLRFYIDDIEQWSWWSWNAAWANYTDNTISTWTHSYKWCFIKDWAWAGWSDSVWVDYITLDSSVADISPPDISSINYASWSLLPWWNHDLIINYSDLESWIDTSSDVISLYKWDWVSSRWSDISSSWLNLSWKTITATMASYPTNNLIYWKYRYDFQISDLAANSSSTWAVFYIDEPELIVSTWSLDIWNLKAWVKTFSNDEFLITVKTVWAGYDLVIKNDSILNYSWTQIIDWNGSEWYGYDKNPYSSTISSVWTWVVLATEPQFINTNWDKNTYIYSIKLWAKVLEEQVAWNYSWALEFTLDLDY